MVSKILHVEDDVALRGLVEIAFTSFGFRGDMLTADSVEQAIHCCDEAARSGTQIDLILTDMNLPDGTGLDVVRFVRASPVWKATPVLILSGDVDPKTVGKAYALGANAYLAKSPHGRSLSEVLKSAYQHWTQDVVLPTRPPPSERIHGVISRAMTIRRRHADLYQRLAELFVDSRAEAAFWLSRALAESNLINLLAFLQHHVHDHDFADHIPEQLAKMQTEVETVLRDAEHKLHRGTITRDGAYHVVADLISVSNLFVLSQWIGETYPKVAGAMDAMHDFIAGTVRDVAAWIDLHSTDPALRDRAAHLLDRLAAVTAHRG